MIYKLEFETVSPCGAGYKFYANDEPICKPDEVPEEYWSKVSRDTDNPWQQYQSLKKWVETGEQLIRNFNLWKMDSEPKWALIEKWTLGSEVHAPQTPSASPIYKSPPSGPTDNDSKERARNLFHKLDLSAITPPDQCARVRSIIEKAFNDALRARLQKQKEENRELREKLLEAIWHICVDDKLHCHWCQGACPNHKDNCEVQKLLSQTPALVHSETEETKP